VELARRRTSALPAARAVRVDIELAEGGVALAVGAAGVAGPDLAELEERADLAPGPDPRDLDRLEVSRRPVQVDGRVKAGEDIEHAGLLAHPAADHRGALNLDDDLEPEILLGPLPDRI